MYRNKDFIYEAVANLEKLINLAIDIETARNKSGPNFYDQIALRLIFLHLSLQIFVLYR